jgi:transposase-like protein
LAPTGETEALVSAIAALASFQGALALPVLRHALHALVDTPSPVPVPAAQERAAPPPRQRDAAGHSRKRRRRGHSRGRSTAKPDPAAWTELKAAVLAERARRGLTVSALADEAGITLGTLRTHLTPAGRPAGAAVAEKLQAWLATAPAVAEAVSFRGNGTSRAAATSA